MTIILIIILIFVVLTAIFIYFKNPNNHTNGQNQESFINDDGCHIYYDRKLIERIDAERHRNNN